MAFPKNINIAILGPVSAGKSTFMNTLFVNQFSDMKIKRTTMTPQIYQETDKKSISKDEIKVIRDENKKINSILIEKTENGETITYEEISKSITYQVPKIYDLVSLKKNIFLSVYDIPGLNDAKTQELYFEYLNNNFHLWDIIIMVVDINSAMNTDGEVRILNEIISNCKKNYDNYKIVNKLFVIANKVDDLEHCSKWGLRIADEEYVEMYEQINKQVKTIVDNTYPDLNYSIMPLSAEDAFIYRMYGVNPDVELDIKHINKFGHNEFGKSRWNHFSIEDKHKKVKEIMDSMNIKDRLQLTGFNYFKKELSTALSPENQYTFLINHILYCCFNYIEEYKKENDTKYYNLFKKEYDSLCHINSSFHCSEGLSKYYEYLYQFVELHCQGHLKLYNEATEENVEHMEWAQKFCSKWKNEFGPTYKQLSLIEKELIDALNKYYVSNIEKQEKPVNTLLSRFKKLISNGFKITSQLVSKIFTNDDMLNKSPAEIIAIIEDMKANNLVTVENQRILVYKTLESVYINIYNGKNFGYINKVDKGMYICLVDYFWQENWKNDKRLAFFAKRNAYKFLPTLSYEKHLHFDNPIKSLEAYYKQIGYWSNPNEYDVTRFM